MNTLTREQAIIELARCYSLPSLRAGGREFTLTDGGLVSPHHVGEALDSLHDAGIQPRHVAHRMGVDRITIRRWMVRGCPPMKFLKLLSLSCE